MLNNVEILQTMSAMANYTSQRHAVVAENISNADTPGFKAKDLRPFSEIYQEASQNGASLKASVNAEQTMETGQAASPNGNSVSIEQQLMLSTQLKGENEMAIAVYRKSLDMMKMAMGKNI